MIENGADARLFQEPSRRRPYFFAMLLGTLFICLSMAVAMGYVIDEYIMFRHRGDNPVPYFISIFFFLGMGFIFSYFYHKKEIEKQSKE